MAPAQAQQCATTCALTSNNTYDSSPLQEGCTLHALLNKPHPTAPHDTWPVEFPPNAPALHTRHPVIAAHAAPVEAGSSEQHHVGTAHSDQTGPHRAATTPAGWRGQLSGGGGGAVGVAVHRVDADGAVLGARRVRLVRGRKPHRVHGPVVPLVALELRAAVRVEHAHPHVLAARHKQVARRAVAGRLGVGRARQLVLLELPEARRVEHAHHTPLRGRHVLPVVRDLYRGDRRVCLNGLHLLLAACVDD
eukprot:CAMPEP_0202865150 /NCGR_PEP_ID=MMETSP1391-20130828/5299_1 /ASSEMBLY_ACC=CAM_ASM_000867 /TAXON_ID=1034604 /ORGANISM="Chlamydomonas leiostraca, Strain SAG 11-49" /LENGTH=248 /DNA_ID=CAMNT_0049544955 /DNA_START=155 /DNA_END=902 /DNA_ORIENTATION=-